MKILSKGTMKQIETMFDKFHYDKIVIDGKGCNKDKAINLLIKDLTYIYGKLGFKE